MGVRGLETFIRNNGGTKTVNIETEIRLWQEQNPEQKPILVFDVMSHCYTDEGMICWAYNKQTDESLNEWFGRLKQCGAHLVFIQSSSVPNIIENVWISRRNDDFRIYTRMYDAIEKGKPSQEIMREPEETNHAFHKVSNLSTIASKYGEYLVAPVGRDCDQAVAEYATKHNAMAVFSADSDFLIFRGKWKFWNYKGTDFNEFTTVEFDRLVISRILHLYPQQRPLLATLMANDFTKEHFRTLNEFYASRRLQQRSEKFDAVAKYIRRIAPGALTSDHLERIVHDIFGKDASNEKVQLFRDSMNYYSLDAVENINNNEIDPIDIILAALDVKALKNYRKLNINAIQTVFIPFYDMGDEEQAAKLNDLQVELLRKRMGIVYSDLVERAKFKILMKKSKAKGFGAYYETPVSPDCSLPLLIELLTNDDSDEELNDRRWSLLAWLLTFSDEQRDKIRSMNEEYRVTCAILLALVQRKIFSVKVADGILMTQMAMATNSFDERELPRVLNLSDVRTAHIYRSIYLDFNNAFITVGLISSVPDFFRFDSAYYQNVMANEFPQKSFEAIQQYRIYSE